MRSGIRSGDPETLDRRQKASEVSGSFKVVFKLRAYCKMDIMRREENLYGNHEIEKGSGRGDQADRE